MRINKIILKHEARILQALRENNVFDGIKYESNIVSVDGDSNVDVQSLGVRGLVLRRKHALNMFSCFIVVFSAYEVSNKYMKTFWSG